MSGFSANTKDVVVATIPERNRKTAGWGISKKGIGVLVQNAYFNYPTPGAGDPTVTVNGAFAYYKWDGTQFLKIGDGAPLLKRKTAIFSFDSNLYTEQQLFFKGHISLLTSDPSSELISLSYESRLDIDINWTAHASLNFLQAWINSNVTGDENIGTKYWIKCIANYNPNSPGPAENLFSYQVG